MITHFFYKSLMIDPLSNTTYFFYKLLMIDPPSEHFPILDHIILSLSGHIQVGATFAWSTKNDLSVMRCVLKKISKMTIQGIGSRKSCWDLDVKIDCGLYGRRVPTFGKWSVGGLGNLSRCWD